MTNEVLRIIKFQMQENSPKRNIHQLYRPPPPQDYSSNYRRLVVVIIIATLFIALQIIGGKIAKSIAIISDAIHLVSDLIGFVFSFVFLYLSKKEMDKKASFGYHRMELIGALLNIFIVWAMVLFIMYEATERIIKKQFVAKPAIMLITAIAGLVINIVLYNILHSGSSHSHGLMSGEHDHSHSHSDHSHSDGYSSDDEQQECGDECKDVTCNKTVKQSHCHKKSDRRVHRHENGVKAFSNRSIQDQISGQLKEVCVENHAHTQTCYLKPESGSHKHVCDGKHDHKHEGHKHDEHKHEGHKHQHHDHEHHDHEHHDHDHHDHQHHDHDHHDHNDPNQKDKHIDHESIGMKSALIHALSDLVQSLGVVVSAVIIYFFGSNNGAEVTEWNSFHLFDPIATYIFSILSLLATLPVIHNCYQLILESVPEHVDLDSLRTEFQSIQGVIDVHDIHVWDLKPGKTIVIAHVFAKKDTQRYVLTRLTDLCRKKRIYHSTFQVQQQQLKNDNDYILCHHDIH